MKPLAFPFRPLDARGPGRRASWMAWALASLSLLACGKPDEDRLPRPETVMARDRAAELGLWGNDGWAEAQRVLSPLVEPGDAAAEDLIRMACAILGTGSVEEALPYLARAEALAPDDPALHWCRFRVARIDYENDEALRELREVRRLAPEDVPSRLAIGMVLADLAMDDDADPSPHTAEAIRELEAFLTLPPEVTGSWRVTALFRLSTLLSRLDDPAKAEPYFAEYRRYADQGIESPGEPEHQQGTLGAIPPHRPRHDALAAALSAPRAPQLETIDTPPGARGFVALDPSRGALEALPGGPAGEELWREEGRLPPRIAVFGDAGLALLARDPDGNWSAPQSITTRPILQAVAFDRGNASTEPASFRWRREGDTAVDLIVAVAREAGFELCLLEQIDGSWNLFEPFFRSSAPLSRASSRSIVPVDIDHEGDLDLIVATAAGPRVLRNDDFDVSPTGMTDVTNELPLPTGEQIAIAEDVDRDNDVDLVFVERASGKLRLLSSERGWSFVDRSADLPATAGTHVAVVDLDGTGFVDFATFSDVLRVYVRDEIGVLVDTLVWPLDAAPTGQPVAIDWDLDGTTDLLWPTGGGGVAGVLAPAFADGGLGFELAPGRRAAGAELGDATLGVLDLDGDFDQDFVLLDDQGLRQGLGDGRKGLSLSLRGYKDNSRGVGAEVLVRDGLHYRRIFWRGDTTLLGAAEGGEVDTIRVVWPNGVIQSYFLVKTGDSYVIWQRPGLVGSCPFLYTWNGETYEFISDVLGITPLGLPMAPGMLVPPDHDEYVLVSGESLVARDGFFELQFTEELREVTYLDRIRLDVVDHPAQAEVFPNERFAFPPFPEPHIHTVVDPLPALAAHDAQGRDWSAELAADDGTFAVPFDPLGGRFQGLATPHFLELSFDPRALREAEKLRLVMRGWFYWTDASVNVAAARHGEVEFVPPLLQVPDGTHADGSSAWRSVEPPLGFPAGKLKTMVVDVTPWIDREDPRLRIFSTLRLYWDSIRLATCDDAALLVVSPLEPSSALLWERGFSEPIPLAGPHRLEWFAWDQLASEPRWNQHPGLYTRFGETLPLLTAIDDRYVIMGSGDALTVRFPADGLPELPEGWRRDYLVFLDGWAKDRDPNTVEALHVEPLPFHGMRSYPYPEDQRFPDDELHREWRREWNTRPGKSLIAPFVSEAPPRPKARM